MAFQESFKEDATSAGRSLAKWTSTAIRESMRNSAAGSSSAVFFSGKRRGDGEDDDEEDLKWAAIERLPTVYRARAGVMSKVLEDGSVVKQEVDLSKLRSESRKLFMDNILKVVEDDNERLLRRLRARVDRVGIELPTIEVRYENLMVETDSYIGKRRIPTLLNALINIIEGILPVSTSKKRTVKMLHGVSGIIRPSRMTLLLGPPGSGKTTLLLALAGKLDKKLRMSGKVTFCGRELSEFIPQRTCAFISQHDLHHSEMTVREILGFSGRCLGVGTNYDMLLELLRREKHAGIKPDPEVDAFMKATSLAGQETSLVTDYILKMLGLDTCADVIVGNEMLRGISGGQRKRVTTGEMLVGPAKALFMDEISTGLDSSTTFQIVKFMRQMVHVMDGTIVISLLQPAPETFNLFDDVILLAEGQIVYQGPRDRIIEFFECIGFKCPERKGVADFLQEVTSRKDQEKYWFDKMQPYKYVSVPEFVQFFNTFHVGEKLMEDLKVPYDRFSVHPAALAMKKYGLTRGQVFKACLSREWLLMKRASFLYIFKAIQGILLSTILTTVFLKSRMNHETISGGGNYLGALFFVLMGMMFNGVAELGMMVHRLPMFYKQRDLLFYPAWAFALPICLLKLPVSVVESSIWVVVTYYGIGFSPAPSRFFRQILAFACLNQTGYSIYRLIAAVARTDIIASTFGGFVMLAMFVLGGFIISKDDIPSSLAWSYYICPLSYAQNALAVNEFLDPRWGSPINDTALNVSTVGVALLKSRGLETNDNWYWISVGALVGLAVFFNVCFVAALTYLNPLGSAQHVMIDDEANAPKEPLISKYQVPEETEMNKAPTEPLSTGIQMEMSAGVSCIKSVTSSDHAPKRAMILPFQPHSLCFNHMSYYVDMPPEMKSQGINESRLQLLCDVSGVIRPGILTALVGVSGAGKTTLMDVLAGRKTGGYIEGVINVSGYPKCQETFARISGYCEQNDIHSPCVTVYESLIFSAWLRLDPDVHLEERKLFVEEVMDLVELDQLRDSLVGLPGVDGLSTEQRKRLTIAVELVANPSIIFMDEPTSGLDARAAAIVMRTVRNTVDTGRTVVCTIHQPSIDIFESFNELLLMKRGGQVIYAGPLGHHSQNIIKYFEAIPGIPKIKDGYNPATWMLEISSSSAEARLNVDFAEIYCNSSLYKENLELVEKFSTASPGSKDLYFPTKYSQSFATQCMACFWKQYWSYWRNPQYNLNRLGMTTLFGVMFGILFWNKGSNIVKLQGLFNLIGCMYSAILFLGSLNCSTVQTTVNVERTILYREKAAGMYSAMAYALGQVSIEVLYVAVQSLVYGLILFFMLGFSWHTRKFLLFMYFMFMTFLNYTMFGMMAVALTPAPQFGLIIMSFVTSLWNLFSGFMIPRPVIPIWWRWYYWLSPMAWTLYGLVTSQVGDKESLIEVPGQQPVPLKALLKDKFGYEYEFIKFAALAQLLFFSLFFFTFVYSIRNFNFQKR